jgi:hypothetical protein
MARTDCPLAFISSTPQTLGSGNGRVRNRFPCSLPFGNFIGFARVGPRQGFQSHNLALVYAALALETDRGRRSKAGSSIAR